MQTVQLQHKRASATTTHITHTHHNIYHCEEEVLEWGGVRESRHTHSLVLVGMLGAMLMRTPLESTTHCWLHLQHRTAINIDYYFSGCCGHLALQKECQRAGMQWSQDRYMQSFNTSQEEDNVRHNDSLFTRWHIGYNCVCTSQCYKTSSSCTSHSLTC